MPAELDALLARLDLVRHSPHGFMARCPCHADRNPSLSIRVIDGAIRCHCFGCGADTAKVHEVIGLPWTGSSGSQRSTLDLALSMGRLQEGQRRRQENHALDRARALHRGADAIRRAVTEYARAFGHDDERCGDDCAVCGCLANAAELDRLGVLAHE